MKNYLSVKEIAEELGVTQRTIRRWISTGKIKAHKVGHLRRISRKSLGEFIGEEGSYPPLTLAHPFFSLVGAGASGVHDISENKYRHLEQIYGGGS